MLESISGEKEWEREWKEPEKQRINVHSCIRTIQNHHPFKFRENHRYLRTSRSWSNTFLSFFVFLMPFSCANCSHLVSGRGTGHFLVRGNTNDGAGSLATIHSSTRSVGCSHNWLTINWTLSRVKSTKYCSLSVLCIFINWANWKRNQHKLNWPENYYIDFKFFYSTHTHTQTWVAFHPSHSDRNITNIPNRFSLRDAYWLRLICIFPLLAVLPLKPVSLYPFLYILYFLSVLIDVQDSASKLIY